MAVKENVTLVNKDKTNPRCLRQCNCGEGGQKSKGHFKNNSRTNP